MSQYSLSVLCHFVALADCIRSGYIGGQLVITRNIFVLLLLPFICILLSVLLLWLAFTLVSVLLAVIMMCHKIII